MLFFVDESGTDRQATPYVILCGISIQEARIWPFIQEQHRLKARYLTSYDPEIRAPEKSQEPKATDLLRKQSFKLAGPLPWLEDKEIAAAVSSARGKRGQPLSQDELRAANQGKIRYVEELLELTIKEQVQVFATVTDPAAPQPQNKDFLGKDFSYLFERFFAFLEQRAPQDQGLLVFDEQSEEFSKRLQAQIAHYFLETQKGQSRASRIVPAPFFAKSHLMPVMQVADLAAYIINWAFRVASITKPAREEMVYLALTLRRCQFIGTRIDRFATGETPLWGIQYIPDLRPSDERNREAQRLVAAALCE